VASGERTRVVDFLSSDLKSFFAELENRRFEGGVAETDDAAVHRSLEKVKAKKMTFLNDYAVSKVCKWRNEPNLGHRRVLRALPVARWLEGARGGSHSTDARGRRRRPPRWIAATRA
jgi:hypothetical protein